MATGPGKSFKRSQAWRSRINNGVGNLPAPFFHVRKCARKMRVLLFLLQQMHVAEQLLHAAVGDEAEIVGMFRHRAREGLHHQQAMQLLSDLAPQDQRRQRLSGSLIVLCEALQDGFKKRLPGLGVFHRRHVRAEHQAGIEQQEALRAQVVLQVGQRLDGAGAVCLAWAAISSKASPLVFSTATRPSATSSIFMKLRSEVARLTCFDKPLSDHSEPTAPSMKHTPVALVARGYGPSPTST